MDDYKNALKEAGFEGEMLDDLATLEAYSHDASMFELRPKLVVRPKDASDIEQLTQVTLKYKA